ncbi:MAG: SDR family oxidoreductase [bacterium]|nr:SDR family oxidoreductase [bacterium]MCY4272065.1 SDR family oxidoreductase [bacterium]
MTAPEEKVCLITGCSSGLGIGLAVELGRRGHIVIATMRDLEKQAALRSALETAGVEASIAALDVQDGHGIESLVNRMIDEHERIDVLVNNAGVGFLLATEDATEEHIQTVLDINVMGVMRTTKSVIPHMRRARRGHVVNISSLAGLVGQPFNEIYCASKFAVEGYTEAMASYMTPAFGICFTSVLSGRIDTEFGANATRLVEGAEQIEREDYRPVREKYLAGAARRSRPESGIVQSAAEVATIVSDCIEHRSPPIRLITSAWAEAMCRIKTEADPTGRRMQQAVIDVFLEGGEVQ